MRLSTFSYYADFFGSIACIAVLCVLAMSIGTWAGCAEWLIWLMIGAGLWTLMEYCIHRWLYHGVEFFVRLHDAHHAEPNAPIGAPPIFGIALIFLVFYAPIATVSVMVASGLTAGVLAGYLAYQLVHHATHFWRPVHGSYLYRARLHHSVHHYHRELGNYGVTCAFWDYIFDTSPVARREIGAAELPADDVGGRAEPLPLSKTPS
jgi:sterol desaturase/sphingolipid hydroxylase (fatty acid hydroxylase superfamily)